MKQSNWKSSGEPQRKSAKTPKFRKRKQKQLKMMIQKLKKKGEDKTSPFLVSLV